MKLGSVLDSDILIYHLNGELDDAGEHLFLCLICQPGV